MEVGGEIVGDRTEQRDREDFQSYQDRKKGNRKPRDDENRYRSKHSAAGAKQKRIRVGSRPAGEEVIHEAHEEKQEENG